MARLPRAGAKSKPHHYKQKVQKMEDIPKTCALTGKKLKITVENNYISSVDQATLWNTRPPKTANEYGPMETVRIELNKT